VESALDAALAQHRRGNELLAQGDFEGAKLAFDACIANAPGFFAGYNGLGVALHRSRDLVGAIAALRLAVEMNPAYAEAADNLGLVLRENGDMVESKKWLLRATQLEPQNGRFLLHLADHEPVHADDPIFDRLQRLAADGGQTTDTQIEGLFAYAKVLEDLQRSDEAFVVLERANQLRRARITYDEPATLTSLETARRTLGRQFVDGTRGCGDPSERPIFIVGMPRSGTTLVEAVLAAHPQVAAGGELTVIEQSIRKMAPVTGIDMLRNELRALGAAYVASTNELAGEAQRLTDKMPFNFRFAPIIHAALPRARIIHVQRNPLDVAYSCFATYFEDDVPFAYDLAEFGRYYAAYEKVMAVWRKALPRGAMLEVAYEEVVADLEGQSRRLLEFCGLDWDDAVLRFHKSRHVVRSASQTQVRRPLYASSVNKGVRLAPRMEAFSKALNGC
jgi:tetratricopeptide (TPR) repeat protein